MDRLTTDCEVFDRHPIHLAVRDGEVAHELFRHVCDDGLVVGLSQPLEHIAMLQQ